MSGFEKRIFCFWTGRNDMSPTRAACLASMRENAGVPVSFLTWREWLGMILPEAPLHPGFKYLSCNHKSDYLRCYFMHHFGGGYSDIKYFGSQNNWRLCFDIMEAFPQIEVIGQPEMIGGTPIKDFDTPHDVTRLLANCYFICRPHSEFTTEWYNRLMGRMEEYLPMLENHPATDVFGRNEGYPVPWSALMGELFHETIMRFREKNPESICSALQTGCDLKKGWR